MPKTDPPASFTVSAEDAKLIRQIADLAVALAKRSDVPYTRMEVEMDLTACHANGCPLDLEKLLGVAVMDPATFGHDIFGIRRFIDRHSGRMSDEFRPRCAAPARAP